jgi:hypothetical protein
LLHDFGSDADHVGVADLAAFYDADDGHAGTEFAGLGRHAHNAGIASFESFKDGGRCHGQRAGAEVFEAQAGVLGVTVFDSGGDAGGYGAAGFVGDEGDAFAGADAEARFYSVFGAGH